VPNLIRHKQFVKDLKKVKFTDKQFEKLVTYISLLLENNFTSVEFLQKKDEEVKVNDV
jgi:mRNA-degrading endonuclease YafQ of YafQ-DinJ toxin-antitoxin module